MHRVLVLGGTGMLGHKLVQTLAADPAFEVHAAVRRSPPEPFRIPGASYHEGLSVDPAPEALAAIRRLVADVAPATVINAVGAIKQRKDASEDIARTFFVNGTFPHLLPLLGGTEGPRVVHVSTDCVFRGDRGGYTEADRPDAEDLYGRSKATGEIDYGRHLTIRTSIIGLEVREHLGLLGWMLSQPRGSRLRGWSRAIFSGLPTCTLSRTIRDLLLRPEPPRGLYQVASQPIDKLTLLRRVSDALDLGHTFEPDPSVTIDRSLRDDRFRAATGTTTPDWDTLVRELREDARSLPYGEVYPSLHDLTPA